MSDVVRILGLTLLHFLWQGALIGIATAALLRSRTVSSAQRRYLICMGALLSCVLVPFITAFALSAPAASSDAIASPAALSIAPVHGASAQTLSAGSFDFVAATVVLWLAGALSVAAWYAMQWRSVGRVQRSARALTEPQALAAAASRLLQCWKATRRVRVMLSNLVGTPIVIGLFRPVIVFPAATLARMPAADFELILLHEIAHIVRRDTWANALQVALEIVFFYHPAVHWISRRARLERECACDDFVVSASGSAYKYAQALTSLVLTRDRASTLALAAAGGDLLARLRHLAGEHTDGDAQPRNALHFASLALLLVSLSAIGPVGQRLTASWVIQDNPLDDTLAERERRPEPLASAQPIVPEQRPDYGHTLLETISVSPSLRTIEAPDLVRVAAPELPQIAAAGEDAAGASEASPTAASVPAAGTSVENPASDLRASDLTSDPPAGAARELDQAPAAQPGPAPAQTERSAAGGPVLVPVHAPLPEYPLRARLDRVEGSVSVVVHVSPDGRTRALHIVEAEPLGVFEGAVRKAVMRWRYEVKGADAATDALTAAWHLRFSLDGISSIEEPVCPTATASLTCRAD